MNAVKDIMQVSHNFVVEEISFAMEDESMDEIFSQSEHEEPEEEDRDHFENIHPCPIYFHGIAESPSQR